MQMKKYSICIYQFGCSNQQQNMAQRDVNTHPPRNEVQTPTPWNVLTNEASNIPETNGIKNVIFCLASPCQSLTCLICFPLPINRFLDKDLLCWAVVCDSVGRAVAFYIRGPRLESSHRQNFIQNMVTVSCWKDENKLKESENGLLQKVKKLVLL